VQYNVIMIFKLILDLDEIISKKLSGAGSFE